MKALIIYEEVPETTKLFAVDITDEDWEWMRLTHNHYVNGTGTDGENLDACNKLSEWLMDKQALPLDDGPLDLHGLGYKYILRTGFFL